jgi:hypothetical protein
MPTPDPLRSGGAEIAVCDRCGQVTVAPERCVCATPHDLVAARRRLSAALAKGRQRRAAERDAALRRMPPAS